MLDLLTQLEEQFPSSRDVQVEWFPDLVRVHRMTFDQLMETTKLDRNKSDQFALHLVTTLVTDTNDVHIFDRPRGVAWLVKHPQVLLELANLVQEFNELTGPSEDRKKKSETATDSDACSPSAETSESDTLDD